MSQNKKVRDVRASVNSLYQMQKLTEAGESLAHHSESDTKAYAVFRFPVIEWNFRWQRPQQMSVQFAREGHRVFYFSTQMHAIEQQDATLEDVSKSIVIESIDTNIWWVKLCSHHHLNLYTDSIEDPTDLQYLQWSLDCLYQKFQLDCTVSIVDLPFWAPVALSLKNNLVIYDCMDDHAGFSTNSSHMLKEERALVQEAGLVVASSNTLFDRVSPYNKETILIRNAVDYPHFAEPPNRLAPAMDQISGPVIGYYGAIAEWFDIGLIHYLARNNKDWTFMLIGNTFGCDTTPVQDFDNVIFTGELPYHELPKYVHGFDVCLIPFVVNNLTLATNPVKMYEYLAAGKPVVSVKLPELDMVSEHVHLAVTFEEFEQAVRQALQERDETKVLQRKEFALSNTWATRYQALHAKIMALLYPKVSIILVSYNQWNFTKQCLDSLFQHTDYPNMEIIVVDNASTDQSKAMLARMRHPQLYVILSTENNGFAGGNSLGCSVATGEYIILLNNDTIVPPGWLTRLIRPLREHQDIGMTAPMSNHVGNDQMLDHFVGDPSGGADPHWLADFYHYYKGRLRYTDLLGFFCVAIKREVYEKVGDLDRGYEIGMFEDDDYCERVKQAGYRMAIVEDAFVYHHGSISFKKMNHEQYMMVWNKNKQYYEQKWGKEWALPKPPASLFFETFEPEHIANKIRTAGKRSILVLGEAKWPIIQRRWQYIADTLTQDASNLVIVPTDTYHNHRLIGTRKVGPSFYLTNRIDLFEQCLFDLVLYCGHPIMNHPWRSRFIAIDSVSYSIEGGSSWTAIPDAVVYHETNVESLVRQMTALLLQDV